MVMVRCAITIICTLWVLFSPISAAFLSNGNLSLAKRALERWICYDDYWRGRTFSPGSYIPIEVKLDREKFEIMASGDISNGDSKAFYFYTGRIKNNDAAIIYMTGYTTDPIGGGVWSQVLEKRKQVIENGEPYKDFVIMPTDCKPEYDPTSPRKESMIRTIVSTVKGILESDNEHKSNAHENTLTITNFNIDYPYTYVLIEPCGDVISITLHNASDYDSEEFERTGQYPWTEIYDPSEIILKRIREHGIVRKIRLIP